jgi:hypothetical protein
MWSIGAFCLGSFFSSFFEKGQMPKYCISRAKVPIPITKAWPLEGIPKRGVPSIAQEKRDKDQKRAK